MMYAQQFVADVGNDNMFRATPSLLPFQDDIGDFQSVLLEVSDPTTLNRVVAQWREYCDGPTYFRGQRKLYAKYPYSGAYRNENYELGEVPEILSRLVRISTGGSGGWGELDELLTSDDSVRELWNGYKDVPEFALEGLFQHYEGSTRWLDVVDNLQIALWMATRKYHQVSDFRSKPVYLVKEADGETGPQEDVYIYLFGFSVLKERFPGLRATPKNSLLLDLREALPARFLRPHAQHSALIKHSPSGSSKRRSDKYLNYAILKIPYDVAQDCCGGSLLSVSSIYPSPDEDKGFAQLEGLIKLRLLDAARELRLPSNQILRRYVDAVSLEGRSLAEG